MSESYNAISQPDEYKAWNDGYEKGYADAIDEFVDVLKTEPFSEYVMHIVYHWQNKLKDGVYEKI